MPGLASLLSATVNGSALVEAYETDLVRPGSKTRHLVVNAQPLADGESGHVRLLVAVTDVTDARAKARLKDDLDRENAILLKEIQHRVANSLQIIASVLMQSARRVQSEEARGHLHNAHHRVMSIAAVQKQLSQSTAGRVALRPYLTQLCESLGASMIADESPISISVTVDDSVVESDVSVSLGLIVTELVINALKHAFPDQSSGRIEVSYRSSGDDWTLSVSDDGVGLPAAPEAAKAGLGTSIIEALTNNLRGELRTSNAQPGTIVTISNRTESGQNSILPPAA